MNNTETKKTTTKRLALTRQTLRTLTADELRQVARPVLAAEAEIWRR